jgi:hypothetical protein
MLGLGTSGSRPRARAARRSGGARRSHEPCPHARTAPIAHRAPPSHHHPRPTDKGARGLVPDATLTPLHCNTVSHECRYSVACRHRCPTRTTRTRSNVATPNPHTVPHRSVSRRCIAASLATLRRIAATPRMSGTLRSCSPRTWPSRWTRCTARSHSRTVTRRTTQLHVTRAVPASLLHARA